MKKVVFGMILYIQMLQASHGQAVRDSVWADSMMQDALRLSNEGNGKAALAQLDTAKEVLVKITGENSPLTGNFYDIAGVIFQNQNDRDTAIFLYRKSIAIRRTYLLQDNAEIARSLNRIGVCYFGKGEYQQAIDHFLESSKAYQSALGADHLKVADAYNNIGYAYDNLGDYNTAIKYHKKSMDIRERFGDYMRSDLDYPCYNIAIAYKNAGEFNTAISYCKRALELRKKIYGPEDLKVAAIYNELGTCYQKTGAYDLAFEMLQKSLDICVKELDSTDYSLMYPYYSLADYYYVSGQYRQAIEFNNKSLSIARLHLRANHPAMAGFYNNLSLCYLSVGEDSIALDYLNKSLEIQISRRDPDHPYLAAAYHNLGNYYIKTGNPKLAIGFYEKALAIQLKKLGNKHPDVANTYLSLGNAVSGEQALLFYQKALEADNYIAEQPDSALSRNLAVNILFKTGETCRKIASTQGYNAEALYRAWSAFVSASKMVVYLRVNSNNIQEILAHQTQAIYEGNILSGLLLYDHTDSLQYLQEAFNCAETSHGFSFYKSLRESDALHFAGIPDSLLQQEYDLRADIAYCEKKRFSETIEKRKPPADSASMSINSKLFDLKRAYEALKDTFEQHYPDYYRLKYDLQVASVGEVQNTLLQPGQTLLEYVVGDSSIFIFLVQKDHFEVQEIKKDFPLEQWVDSMTRFGIYAYYSLPKHQRTMPLEQSVKTYTAAAQRLYEKLIAPVKARLTRELIIIPDGVLGYVPFEALLTKAPARPTIFSSYHFLVQEHQVSYCYSATLLREMRDKQHRKPPTEQLLALAPFFRKDVETLDERVDSLNLLMGLTLRDSLAPLEASGEEVAAIAKIWKGRALYDTAATVDAFRRQAGLYRILHLSTHGKADDRVGDYAFLAFAAPSDSTYDKLYARDLYNLELNADMVALSACETATGKLQRGEGIVSLARAFAYAGAKSLVTTLWKVDDIATRDLMAAFYRHLRAGKTKDAALRQAKLDFLKNNRRDGGAALHPFFWAGFVAIGDMRPLK